MGFKWTDLIPSFIGAGTAAEIQAATAEQQLELLRQIYNQVSDGRRIQGSRAQ